MPGGHLTAGFMQNPEAEGDDEPCLLGNRNEFARVEQTPPRVVPTDQRLEARDALINQRYFRLIVQYELASLDRLFQICFDFHARNGTFAHALVKYFETP